MSLTLIEEMVSQVFACVQTHQIVLIKYVPFFVIIYTSIELFFSKKENQFSASLMEMRCICTHTPPHTHALHHPVLAHPYSSRTMPALEGVASELPLTEKKKKKWLFQQPPATTPTLPGSQDCHCSSDWYATCSPLTAFHRQPLRLSKAELPLLLLFNQQTELPPV